MTAKKKADINLSLKSLLPVLHKSTHVLHRYAAIMFFLIVASVYGFVIFRINSLSNAQPTDSDITAQTQSASVPKVDPQVVKQLEALKDNSVNVQTLFNQARNNPFQ